MICIWLLFSRIDDSGRNWTRVRFPVAIALKAAIVAASIEWAQQLLAILLALAIYGPCMWELTTLVGPDIVYLSGDCGANRKAMIGCR